jgi:hypothetical protein
MLLHVGSTLQVSGLKGSCADKSVPDAIARRRSPNISVRSVVSEDLMPTICLP